MKTLHRYLLSLTQEQRAAFATAAGTTLGYLNNALYRKNTPRFDGALCRRLEEASAGAVPRESLRPDIWPERVSVGGAQ